MMITVDQIEAAILTDNTVGKVAIPSIYRDDLVMSSALRKAGRAFVPAFELDGVTVGLICFLN